MRDMYAAVEYVTQRSRHNGDLHRTSRDHQHEPMQMEREKLSKRIIIDRKLQCLHYGGSMLRSGLVLSVMKSMYGYVCEI